jgi:hypothetical protein
MTQKFLHKRLVWSLHLVAGLNSGTGHREFWRVPGVRASSDQMRVRWPGAEKKGAVK